MEELAKKIQVLERKIPELPLPGNMIEDNRSTDLANETRVQDKELEENNKKDQDLIGVLVILCQ